MQEKIESRRENPSIVYPDGVTELVKNPLKPPLTFQGHGSIFRKLVGVKEHSGLAIQRVLNIEHILVLEAFIVKVEIPKK